MSVGILHYHTLLFHYTSQVLWGLAFVLFTIGGLWQPPVDQVSGHHLPKNICSLCVSGSDFSNSQFFKSSTGEKDHDFTEDSDDG